MPAGGFKTFVAGEILTAADTNSFLMQGMLVFADATARDAAITSPVEGQFAFLKDDDIVTFYDGTDWVEFSTGTAFEYLVVGGGGGGGDSNTSNRGASGGGGAGGYRNSFASETSGGNQSTEATLLLEPDSSFTVTVGAGGASRTPGNDSFFANIVSVGGGDGLRDTGFIIKGGNGGSGGGGPGNGNSTAGASQPGGKAVVRQGFAGGLGFASTTSPAGAGGGGAGQVGANGALNSGGNGGNGLSSSITGSAVTRGGGGGGAGWTSGNGTGGTGGGGNGSFNGTGGAGTVNTGGGGGGGSTSGGGAGGSGIVVLRYPDKITLTIGAGLTSSTSSSGGFKVTTFTAGTDTVSI
jgi:hypothetical protein